MGQNPFHLCVLETLPQNFSVGKKKIPPLLFYVFLSAQKWSEVGALSVSGPIKPAQSKSFTHLTQQRVPHT